MRSAKQMRRMVQIFVKVDELKMVVMEVSPEDKSPFRDGSTVHVTGG